MRNWGKSCCVHQVLAVFDPSLGHRITQIADAVVRILTERLVVPRDREARWERPRRYTLLGARGWWPMCENVGLVCIEVEYDQHVLNDLVGFVTPRLIKVCDQR